MSIKKEVMPVSDRHLSKASTHVVIDWDRDCPNPLKDYDQVFLLHSNIPQEFCRRRPREGRHGSRDAQAHARARHPRLRARPEEEAPVKIFAIAMCEVQEDSVLCGSDALMDWDAAVDAADDFMMRCIGDFYEIDPADTEARRAKVEERVCRETSVFKGERKLECHYEAEGLVVATSVQETEVR